MSLANPVVRALNVRCKPLANRRFARTFGARRFARTFVPPLGHARGTSTKCPSPKVCQIEDLYALRASKGQVGALTNRSQAEQIEAKPLPLLPRALTHLRAPKVVISPLQIEDLHAPLVHWVAPLVHEDLYGHGDLLRRACPYKSSPCTVGATKGAC